MCNFVSFVLAVSYCVHLLGVFTDITLSQHAYEHNYLHKSSQFCVFQTGFSTLIYHIYICIYIATQGNSGNIKRPQQSQHQTSLAAECVFESEEKAEINIIIQSVCMFVCAYVCTRSPGCPHSGEDLCPVNNNESSQDFNGNIISCLFVLSLALGVFSVPAAI